MRTLAKTATYSVMHVTVAFTVAYIMTGRADIALGISLIEPGVQTFTFYFHERAWDRFSPVKIHAKTRRKPAPERA